MADRSADDSENRVWESFDNLERLWLAAICAGCAGVFYLLASVLRWPVFPGSEVSLLASTSPVAGFAAVMVGMLLCIVSATWLAGRMRYEAGLFAAGIGLAWLANRGGTVGALLRTAGRPQVYRTLVLESVLLLGILSLAWQLLALMRRRGSLAAEPALPAKAASGSLNPFAATLVQVIAMALLMLLLTRSDNKKQVMCALVAASLVASVGADQMFPTSSAAAAIVAPFVVAIAGYAWAVRSPGQWIIGIPANALANAAPLDYASLGVASSIFGHWVSRQWHESA